MPFEEIDKKIKEAADNHHPAYNENAWDKMDGLLNKHMPEKKERRRAALLLLLLLITAGGAGYFLVTKMNADKPGIVNNKSAQKNESSVTIPNEKSITNETLQNERNKENTVVNPLVPSTNNPVQNRSLTVITSQKNNKEKKLFTNPTHFDKPGLSTTADQPITADPSPSINTSNEKISLAPVSKNPAEIKSAETGKQKTEQAEQANDKPLEQQPQAQAKKARVKKGSGLFLSLSAGPDVSAIELDNAGKLKLAAGIGVGYKFGDRFSIQTGFYTSRKIYTAQSYEYNAPNWWWTYYPRLESVNANCKVYEIPLLVNYNFARSNKANWFATTGLSSYLMKKEEYTYNYKTSTGQPASRNWTYNNENKHYFSVLTLSGGYERNLNKQLSLSISPYFKIPLAGVGFGKVKLNSAGLMMNVNFKPFVKK